jgi:hypothetical protein
LPAICRRKFVVARADLRSSGLARRRIPSICDSRFSAHGSGGGPLQQGSGVAAE